MLPGFYFIAHQCMRLCTLMYETRSLSLSHTHTRTLSLSLSLPPPPLSLPSPTLSLSLIGVLFMNHDVCATRACVCVCVCVRQCGSFKRTVITTFPAEQSSFSIFLSLIHLFIYISLFTYDEGKLGKQNYNRNA